MSSQNSRFRLIASFKSPLYVKQMASEFLRTMGVSTYQLQFSHIESSTRRVIRYYSGQNSAKPGDQQLFPRIFVVYHGRTNSTYPFLHAGNQHEKPETFAYDNGDRLYGVKCVKVSSMRLQCKISETVHARQKRLVLHLLWPDQWQ